MASGSAIIKEVVSGDSLVLIGSAQGGRAPQKNVSLSSIVAPKVAMKSLTFENVDEPFGWESREFMRKRLIGETVSFQVEYSHNGKEYACVKLNGENIAYALLKEGLAKVLTGPNAKAADYDELLACQAEAETRQKNIFSSARGITREIQWTTDIEWVDQFVGKYKHSKLPAIVEYVRDASFIRLAIKLSKPEETPVKMVYSYVALSGIKCPGSKKDAEGNIVSEPFYEEARAFVEMRLLNRDVELRVEGKDSYGNLYGTVFHPKGNISVLLLSSGFAIVAKESLSYTEAPSQYYQALKEAQSKELRRWKGFTKSFDDNAKSYAATVCEIVSGDCLILSLPGGSYRRVFLASIRCPRMGESLAFESKELLRKKCIGKEVQVYLEYVRPPPPSTGNPIPGSDEKGNMHFVSIYLPSGKETTTEKVATDDVERKGVNISSLLLKEGYARTVPHRSSDPTAEEYDQYLEMEQAAQKEKKGVFAPPHLLKPSRIVDLVGPANTQRAIAHTQQLIVIPKLAAVVEHVFNAGRFKLRIPSQNLHLSFALSGIRCPQTQRPAGSNGIKAREGEPFGIEALEFSKTRIMQKDVFVKIEQCDKGGNFIGILWYGPKQQNLACEILEQGYGMTVDFSLARTACKDLLVASEQTAKSSRLNLWSLPGALEAEEEEKAIVEPIISNISVSHVEDTWTFYLQDEASPDLLHVTEELAALTPEPSHDEMITVAGIPRKNELVLGRFSADSKWYRARVLEKNTKVLEVKVLYVDFGNCESLLLEDLRRCPPTLTLDKIPAQARVATLAGLLPPPDIERDASEYFSSIVAGRQFHCEVFGKDQERRLCCYMTELGASSSQEKKSVNEILLRNGLAILDRKYQCPYMKQMQQEEEYARKSHLNVWRYGDIGVQEDDDDFPSLGKKVRATKVR